MLFSFFFFFFTTKPLSSIFFEIFNSKKLIFIFMSNSNHALPFLYHPPFTTHLSSLHSSPSIHHPPPSITPHPPPPPSITPHPSPTNHYTPSISDKFLSTIHHPATTNILLVIHRNHHSPKNLTS